jgi:ATP-dependent helicase/nuclease subunit B
VSRSTLIVSASNHARVDRAKRWLLETARAGRPEALVIAPTRRAADDFARDLCPSDQGVLGIHRATPMQLASEIASPRLVDKTAAPLGALGSLALATRAIHLALRSGPLDYFEPVARMPGFARALSSTLLELRLESIAATDLAERVGAAGRDLARLKRAYEDELERARLKDAREVLSLAAEVAETKAHRFAAMPILFLDVSPATMSEAALLRALAKGAPEVLATILAGDERGTALLTDALGADPIAIDGRTAADETALDRARRFVFSTEEPTEATGDATLDFFSAPGEGREAAEIARRILRSSSEGVRFDRMAIFLRDPDRYQPLVEEALRRARIPAFFTSGTARPDPSGRALLALIACAAEGLSASRFAEYLSLGQVPVPDENGAPKTITVPWVPAKDDVQLVFKATAVDVAAEEERAAEEAEPEGAESREAPVVAGSLRAPFGWERLLVDASVIGKTPERWKRRLKGLAEELDAQLAEIGRESTEHDRLLVQRQRLAHLSAFALPIISFLSALPREATWKAWLDALTELAGMALKKTASVVSLLEELRPMEDVGPVALEEVREVLLDRLTFLRAEPPNRRYGKVFVGALEDAAGRAFDVVFLPGLAEGIFPKKKHEDPLLLDDARRKLGDHLEIQARRSAEERLLLMLVLGSAVRRIVASYPRMDVGEGRSRVPSFYALDLLRAAEGRLPHLRALEKRAEEAAGARLGWPAPRSAEDAIDDAEYDLAILDDLLRRPPDDTRGSARYMILANEHLSRSLHARAARWRSKFGPSDCFLAVQEEAKAAIAEVRLGRKSYAPTDLEHFAACPYRFHLKAIQRLYPRERAVALEELDARTKGSIIHDVEHALFDALERDGLLPVSPARLERALDHLSEIADELARKYEEKLAPAIPRVYWRDIEGVKKDLRGLLRHTAENHASWRPIAAEQAFGGDGGLEIFGEGFRIKGRIDLIEEHVDKATIRVTDYKSGKRPEGHVRHVGCGEKLQPLLYALAAEKMLGRRVHSGRLYFATAREDYDSIEIELDDESREAIHLVLFLIDEMVAQGFLPAAPRKSACATCDYRIVCGPLEERRILYKDDSALGALVRLRGMS